MRNNEFEKRVEHKLEELRFTPSDAVWQKVERQIRERKRRRRFLFWWLPGFLLCTGILGWYIFSLQTVRTTASSAIAEKKLSSTSNSANQQLKPVEPVTEIKKDTEKKISQAFTRNPVQEIKNSTTATAKKINTPAVNSSFIKAAKPDFKKEPRQSFDSIHNGADPLPASPLKNVVKPVVIAEPIVEQKKDTVAAVIEKPILKEEEKTVITTDSAAVTTAKKEVAVVPPVINKKKKPELAAVFSTGISDMSRFTADLFHSADRVYSAPATSGSGSGYPVPAAASDIKAGVGFSAGLQIKTPLAKRTALSVGLAYSYYSTSQRIGTTVYASAQYNNNVGNIVVDRYTTTGNNNVFHSRYHFIELPLNYHLQLSRPNKRPVSFNSGITGSYLVRSNAMYFHKGTGSYYYDAELYSRVQFQLQTGISLALVKKLNYPLMLGVQYKFGLSGQWKKPLDLNQHLSFTGINVSWRLNSK